MGRSRIGLAPHGWAVVALALCVLTGCRGSAATDENSLGPGTVPSASQATSGTGDSTQAVAGGAAKASSEVSASTGKLTKKSSAGSGAEGLAKKSEKLETVTQPPASTVARIDSTKAQAGSRYSIVFSPYGKGPGGGLVIAISESRPAANAEEPFDFDGRNALVDTSRLPAGQTIDEGGTYDGTLELVESGGLLVPYLVNVESGSRAQ